MSERASLRINEKVHACEALGGTAVAQYTFEPFAPDVFVCAPPRGRAATCPVRSDGSVALTQACTARMVDGCE